MRGDDVVNVAVREDPCTVTLTAGSTAPPSRELRDRWVRSVDYVADHLRRALPEISPWVSEDLTGIEPAADRSGSP